ncbi:MAG: 4-hydroxy-tetrahydrodipicolinate synthase [Candidatus Coatesbacteria bacterium]|nr:4-hydroxy-tetrahydrodipicolinate synthase [Candidatus Coatesbacteria bacterium]
MFKGSYVALVTPFRNGKVAFNDYAKLLDYHLESGTDGILLCGTTGESATLTRDEYREIITFVKGEIDGRIPIIAGIGSNDTRVAIENARICEEIGIDGVLAISCYYNKPTQAGHIAHFTKIASSTRLPVIIYNIPGRTAVNLLPSTLEALCDVPNIVGVKESSGDMRQVLEIRRLCGDRLFILSGEDLMVVPILSIGGSGVISASANILAKEMAEMCQLFFEGDLAKAARIQIEISEVINACFIETNPGPVKTALEAIGRCSGELRLPLVEMQPANKQKLLDVIRRYGMI